MKTKMKENVKNERTGRHALRGEIMSGRQKNIYEIGGKIQTQPKQEIKNLISEIERILGRDGYRRFRQLGFPGEFKASYVKDNRIITISDIPEANDMQISSVKGVHAFMLGTETRVKAKGRIKKEPKKGRIKKEPKKGRIKKEPKKGRIKNVQSKEIRKNMQSKEIRKNMQPKEIRKNMQPKEIRKNVLPKRRIKQPK